MDEQVFMKEKAVFPLVVMMALPMTISMLVNALYNIVDSFFVAKISEDAMTALSLVFPLQNLMMAVGVGFGIGINAVIAYHLGAEEKNQADLAAAQGMICSVLHGVVLAAGCYLALKPFLGAFTQSAQVLDLALRYGRIVVLFGVINTIAVAFEKIFQSVGRMRVSMISMMSGCLVNIVLDPILIFGLGPVPAMGIEGAALATGIGQTVPLLVYLLIYRWKPIPVSIHPGILGRMKPDPCFYRVWAKLYQVGIPATLNMALSSCLISALNRILSAYSQSYVLVLGVYYKLQTFLYLTGNGVIQGIRPIIGYNYGAKEYQRVKKIYWTAFGIIATVMAAGTLLCLWIPGPIFRLFTENARTVAIGAQALRIISAGFVVSVFSVTTSGALEGLGKGGFSLILSLMRYVVVIIPLAFFFSRLMGGCGVWYAMATAEYITAGAAILLYRRVIRQKEQDQN